MQHAITRTTVTVVVTRVTNVITVDTFATVTTRHHTCTHSCAVTAVTMSLLPPLVSLVTKLV